MLARQVLKWGKVGGAMIALTVLPILLADWVLSRHALSTGRDEARAAAERLVERADQAVSEALQILRETRTAGATNCTADNRSIFGTRAFNSVFIQQVGIVDTAGTLLCAEPMGSLTQPIRLPPAAPADPPVMLGVLTGGRGDRQAVVTLTVDQSRRLVARISRTALAIEPGPDYLQERMTAGVFLDDGAQWLAPDDHWTPQSADDVLTETVASTRFPIKAMISAPASAALENVAPLRAIVLVAGTIVGIAVFAVASWTNWRSRDGNAFQAAVENQEFVPHYQPIFDLFTGEVKGCEVLVRWQRPDGSMVPPGQFLQYAEATGAIREITRQLMERTVEDVAEIYGRNPQLKLSVNLTAMHFNDLGITDEIREIYGPSLIRYDQLCFEVTEQHPLKDLNLSRAIIGRIQSLGAQVALDDVGTGHGGLAYLQKLGVDIIKIDKMFIDNITTDHSSQTIVDTLVELGTQLGLGIMAEGVEREDQAAHLRKIGVATAQGYLFSKPLPAKAYLELLEKNIAEHRPTAAPPVDRSAEETGVPAIA